jgi:hypothetical protein
VSRPTPDDGEVYRAYALCTLVAWLRVPLDRFTVDAPTEEDV